MNIVETEKIIGLINSSPILTAAERAEWLALLDVMNDRQLGELKGILVGGRNVGKSEVGGQQAATKAITSPSPSLERRGMGPQPQMPRLSHIVNLPNLGDLGQVKYQTPIIPPQIKKPSVFASKLKALFQEKELPAGRAELDLPDGEENRNKEIGNKEIDEIRGREIQTAEPKPFFPVKENPLVSPRAVKPVPPVLKVPLPPVPRPKSPPPAAPVLPPAPPVQKPPPSIIIPSVNLAAKPEKKPAFLSPVSKSTVLIDKTINSLQDLALIESLTLEVSSLDDLVKRIKLLIAQYGYFEVIFNLEKSPAYKNYISTGLKLLSGQSGLQSPGRGQDGNYLSKEQFEKFADLLSRIQTS